MGREEHTAVKVGELEDRRKEADKIRVKGEKKDFYLHLSLSITNIKHQIKYLDGPGIDG